MVFQIFNKKASRSRASLRAGFVTHAASKGGSLHSKIAEQDNLDLQFIASRSVTRDVPPHDVNVLVYDLDPTSEDSLAEFDRFMSVKPADMPVIVLSPAVDDELVRWFLRLRVADWVKTPLTKGELVAACGRVLSQAVSARQSLRCLTFIGARGGVGATTLAVHAAMILNGKEAPVKSTMLADLDLSGGACADYLDLTPGWQIDELIADPSRLDERMLDIMATVHSSGVPVLSAHRGFLASTDFSEDVVIRALDAASRKFANLVVDLPRFWQRWTESVLAGSSEVYVVTDASVPGLKAASRLLGELAKELAPQTAPRIIVNKFGRGLFGAGLSASEIRKHLGPAFAGTVSNEEKLVREAIDRGVPVTDIKSKNAIMRDLGKILEQRS